MEQSVPDFHPPNYTAKRKSPAFLRRPGFFYNLRRNQPRVRERIMKLS